MFKKILFLLVAMVFLLFVTSCGPSVDKNLTGTWEEVERGDILVFTDDGKMGRADDADDVAFNYRYKASKGSGEYWFTDHSDIKSEFKYSVSGDTLEFRVTGGYSGNFERVK